MALLLSGYWGGEYWPDSYWHPDYWPGRMTSITLDVSRRTRGASAAPAAPVEKVVETKKLEVGAGARIGQEIGVDPNPVDFWQEAPAGMIYVNFTGKKTLQEILDAGRREDKAEGPLNDMKIGN